MPYRFLEEIAIADAAFEAWGETVEEVFMAAAEAMMNLMVADLETIRERQRRALRVEAEALDMLLFEFLEELIFHKDADQLLLRIRKVDIQRRNGRYFLEAEAGGEELDPKRHDLIVDVKAVTLHRFSLEKTEQGWKSTVVLDI